MTLPPLRVRKGDIPLLAEHFGRRMAVELTWSNWPGFSEAAQSLLENYDWPGNVRELRNVVERAVYRHEDPERPIPHVQFDPFQSPWVLGEEGAPPSSAATEAGYAKSPAPVPAAPAPVATDDLRGAVNAYEKAILSEALGRHRYNQRATAAALGLSYDQIRHAMKRHKLQELPAA